MATVYGVGGNGRSPCEISPQMCRTFWVIREMLESYGLADDHVAAVRARYTNHLEAMIMEMRLSDDYSRGYTSRSDFSDLPTPPFFGPFIPWANWLTSASDESNRLSLIESESESLGPIPRCRVIIRHGETSPVQFDLTPMNLAELRAQVGRTPATADDWGTGNHNWGVIHDGPIDTQLYRKLCHGVRFH
jgi:hypothetical protein